MIQARYINRELSWLAFNQRVLHECFDVELPLSERLKFCAIFSNNLDEFFMIRVSGLSDQLFAGYQIADPSGLLPEQQLAEIRKEASHLVQLQTEIANDLIMSCASSSNIRIHSLDKLNERQLKVIEHDFFERIFPVLTPMAVDFGRPFPLVLNKSLNVVCKLAGEEQRYATIQVPSVLGRLVAIEGSNGEFVLLEEVIMRFMHVLFEGYEIQEKAIYRVTRNGDISFSDAQADGAEDLLRVIEASLKQRKWGDVIRLEVQNTISPDLLQFLTEKFEVDIEDIYAINGLIDLTFLFYLSDIVKKTESNPVFLPRQLEMTEENIFNQIKAKDIFLHHPFDSFDTVIQFIKTAARDPKVLAIKQVLYRVGGDSPIIKALQDAANRGKQVTVLVELMARFDEENNIHWAKSLEKNGCHVIYGLEGKKTHAKIALVVRQEEDGIYRYVHLSTGNYNDKTARIYTDTSIMTCHEGIGQDASKFFNVLSGYVNHTQMNHLVAAPTQLKPRLLQLIQREIEWAKSGLAARIVVKINALVDSEIIEALYSASCSGVKIELVVRGVCCLIPGVPNLSENIKVVSIVGSFLEHSRMYYFHHGGAHDLYIASADWMPRNLLRRVELMIPIIDPDIKRECLQILDDYVTIKEKARILTANGLYCAQISDSTEVSMQEKLSKQNKHHL